MKTITEEHLDFKGLEKLFFEIMCRVACKQIQQYLTWYDRTVMALRDTKRYRLVDSKRKRVIKTVFGEIAYTRRYYYDTEARKHVALLDEVMRISKEYGLVSENLAEQIVNECSDKSFRKAAESISSLTGQSISGQGAWDVVQRYGNALEQQENRLMELYESGSVGHLGNIYSRVLFEEFDDVWIPRQRERRRKPGTALKGAKKIGSKLGKRPMRVGISYTGWSQSKDGRHSTVNKMAYASFGKSSEFIAKFGALQNHCYDIDSVEHRITNGDGESWIRTVAEENNSILQLNPFHRSKATIRGVSDKSDRQLLFKSISEKNLEKTLELICDLYITAKDEKEQKKLGSLFEYFYNNSDSFLTWQERGIELPAPPKGITYRNLGIQESNNCIYTQRMKHRKGAWSENGGNNMARILSFRNTIGFDLILSSLPKPLPEEAFGDPLSVAKAPQYDGNGYSADWLHISLPFEETFNTHGREAIKGIFRMKSVSGLSFI